MRAIVFCLLLVFGAVAVQAEVETQAHPEARPFDAAADASAEVNAALVSAAQEKRNVILVMGGNWCHDSRALAGWFASPRFAEMLALQYKVVFIDVGVPQTDKGRNLDIARRFGIGKVKGTPLVLVLSPGGVRLNSKKDAASWRNAASRSEDDVFGYFADFEPTQK